jgi:hypothetical protein
VVAVEQGPCHHAYAAGLLSHHLLHQASAAALLPLLQVLLLHHLELHQLLPLLLLEVMIPLRLVVLMVLLLLHQGSQDQCCREWVACPLPWQLMQAR